VTALGRIGISESQAIADDQARRSRAEGRYRARAGAERSDAQREQQARLAAHWRSRRRPAHPPRGSFALVAWFASEYLAAVPGSLHLLEPWSDRLSAGEWQQGLCSVGGSRLGSPAYAPAFRAWLEASPHARDADGEFRWPFRSALARLHRERPAAGIVLEYLARCGFDPTALVDRPLYGQHDLVVLLPAELLGVVLESALVRLWWLVELRSAHPT